MRIALLAALLFGAAVSPAPSSAAPPARTCSQRIGFEGPPYWGQQGSLVVGPLSFSGLVDHAAGARQPDGRWFVKSVLLVRPGAAVTLSLVPGSSTRPVLVYAHRESQAVRFEPCPSDVTAFSGGFVIRRLGCATVVVRVEGGATYRRKVDLRGALAAGRCP